LIGSPFALFISVCITTAGIAGFGSFPVAGAGGFETVGSGSCELQLETPNAATSPSTISVDANRNGLQNLTGPGSCFFNAIA